MQITEVKKRTNKTVQNQMNTQNEQKRTLNTHQKKEAT